MTGCHRWYCKKYRKWSAVYWEKYRSAHVNTVLHYYLSFHPYNLVSCDRMSTVSLWWILCNFLLITPYNFWLVILLSSSRSPSKPLARKLMSGMDWEVVSRNSLSDDRLETQSLPSRSPPGTPNQYVASNLLSLEATVCLSCEWTACVIKGLMHSGDK